MIKFNVMFDPESGRIEIRRNHCDCVAVKVMRKSRNRDLPDDLFKGKGVYILVTRDANGTKAYVGESGDVKDRFNEHRGKNAKFNWQDALVFLNDRKDYCWNGDEIYDIQGQLIHRFRERGFPLEANRQDPKKACDDFEYEELKKTVDFIEEFLPVLGYPELVRSNDSERRPASDVYVCTCRGCSGEGMFTHAKYPKGFTVLKGSKCNLDPAKSFAKVSSKKVQDRCIAEGVISAKGVFTRNCEFSSASCAAEVLSSAPQDGLDAWRRDGKKLGEYEPSLRQAKRKPK